MSDIGQGIASALSAAFVATILITAAVTVSLIYGLPWLWHILKPLLHRVTS